MENDLVTVYRHLLNAKQLINDYDTLIKMWMDILSNDNKSEEERIKIVVSNMETILKRNKN